MQAVNVNSGPSLSTGASVLNHIRALPSGPELIDIFIDRDGAWFVDGRPVSPARALRSVDLVVHALHGSFGESGQAGRMFETFGVPYTGARPLAAALTFNAGHARRRALGMRLRSPQSVALRASESIYDEANKIIREIPFPLLVTPLVGSTGKGRRADHFEALLNAIHAAASEASDILVEALRPGRIAAIGIIEGFRGEELYALPVTELQHDYVFLEPSQVVFPASFSLPLKRKLAATARAVHREFGVRQYAQYEFLVTPDEQIQFLHARTLPPFSEKAVFPTALEAVGANLGHFLEHVIVRVVK
jgi:D-alanine-D-alanine ligase